MIATPLLSMVDDGLAGEAPGLLGALRLVDLIPLP